MRNTNKSQKQPLVSYLSFLGLNSHSPQVLGELEVNNAKLTSHLLNNWVIPSQGSLNQMVDEEI